MLILTRRIGESICIGDSEVTFTVLGVDRVADRVKIGILAPGKQIWRKEVMERMESEQCEPNDSPSSS